MKDIVILAAGVGSRLRPITNDVPKTMVPVKDETIIKRLLSQIQSSKIENKVHIVTGYKHDVLVDYLSNNGFDCNVILNKVYDTTNNMYSLQLALNQLINENDLMIINADCVYDTSIVEGMLKSKGNTIAIDKTEYMEESMKVELNGSGKVKGIAKAYKEGDNVFVSIDIYSFDPQHKKEIHKIVNKTIDAGDLNSWTEVAIDTLAKQENSDIKTFDIHGAHWVEIDNHDDLAKANRIM